ncbi:hypothetical protein NSE01_14700 [Novosphingobium sediminis]|uniref:Uncharacterized protein n=2 Tax=Novosphingobium sediminis TaxID=707214 RepID=A0A512AIU6_9SPHN|nr:hypothetical protein NSE01_14700 [Novosphingobium sediminis]
MNAQTLRMPVRNAQMARAGTHYRPDPMTLWVLAIMAVFTISTPAVEVLGLPRITVVSAGFTLYMLFRIRGRLNPDLMCFVFAYVAAFVPSTIAASFAGDVRIVSVAQGVVGLVTLMVIGTYFLNWLRFTPQKKIAFQFRLLVRFFLALTIIEIAFFQYFVNIRTYLYRNSDALADVGSLLSRELTVYGGRPSGLFSEPSHFARYIGLMMIAYISATKRSVPSLWASGAFMLATRSVSFFFAIPAMFIEARQAALADTAAGTGKRRKSPIPLRIVGVGIVASLALAGIYYTQSDRINAALGTGSNSAVTGDNSLNERIVLPAGYFVDGPKSLLIGLGPTPQDEMQEYTLFATRSAYHSRLSSDYKSAVSATIFTLGGMGYTGIAIMLVIMFQLRGRFGVGLVFAYFISNTFSSGYHSATSLVPSGLLLSILIFQKGNVAVRRRMPRQAVR